jgi:hypothetical protein
MSDTASLGERTRGALPSVAADGLTGWLARVCAWRAVSVALALYAIGTDALIAWHGMGFIGRGVIDEPAHLATALVVLGTITRFRGSPPSPAFTWSMLLWSVFIDLDHIPEALGTRALTAGTPRPYTHALWLPALLLLAWAVTRFLAARQGRPRTAVTGLVLAGAVWGLAAHFTRDIATAWMSLWWPVSDYAVNVPYWWYVAALAVLIAAGPVRRRRDATDQARQADQAAA